MTCYNIQLKKYREGYDHLATYLSLRPFSDEPLFHGMAGLLASFLFYLETSLSLASTGPIDWDELSSPQRSRSLFHKAMDHFKKYFELPAAESCLGGSRHESLFRYYYDCLQRLVLSPQEEAERPLARKRKVQTANKRKR